MPSDPGDEPRRGERTEEGTVEVDAVEDAEPAADREPGPDEVYCMSCGAVIKERAEICPECGVRQELDAVGAGAGHGSQAETRTQGHQGQGTAAGAQSGAQPRGPPGGYAITEKRRRELESVAGTSTAGVVLVGFLFSPVAYLMVNRAGLALLNFFTFNYFLLGPLLVPLHCAKIVGDAERELRQAGVEGY